MRTVTRLSNARWHRVHPAERRALALRFVAALVITCALLAGLAGCRPEAETPGETEADGMVAENEQKAPGDGQKALIGSWEGLGGPSVAEWMKFYPPEMAAATETKMRTPETGEATSVGVFEVLQGGQLARGTYRLKAGSLQVTYRFYDAAGTARSRHMRQTFAAQPTPSLLRLTGRSGRVFIYGRMGKASTPKAAPRH